MAGLSFDDLVPTSPAPASVAPTAVQPSASALPQPAPGLGFDDLVPQQPAYTGKILPFSEDASGNVKFDMSAGIPGAIQRLAQAGWSAVNAPADAYAGKLPLNDPETANRAANFAMLFSPASAALRAGEMVPGEIATTLGAPTAQQLKDAAGQGYTAARNSGLDINADAVAGMAQGVQADLQREGFVPKVAPKTHSLLDDLSNPPSGAVATIPDLESARRAFGKVSGDPTDEAAAGRAVRGIDNFLGSLDPQSVVAGTAAPEDVAAILRDARGNYAAAMRSNALTGDLDRANTGVLGRAEARAAATNSGQNLDNAIRQRVASILEKPAEVSGYSQAELDALRNVVQGGPIRNAARTIGNVFGGGGGLGHLVAGGLGAAAGHATGGGLEGAAIGAAVPAIIGHTAKAFENSLAQRSLGAADEAVRMNSPYYREMQLQQLLATPAMGRNSAALRIILPGLLTPPNSPTPKATLAQILAGA